MKETFYKYNVPLKICLLSDIHDKPFDEITISLKNNKPDLIAVAGDIINRIRLDTDVAVMKRTPYALDFLKACVQISPTFFSLGNHEWMLSEQDKQIIRDCGVHLVDNNWESFGEMLIGGLTSSGAVAYENFRRNRSEAYPYWHYFNAPQRHEPKLDWLDEFEKLPGYKLLLCHHPEYQPKYLSTRKIDLILSGHAHGGQIRIFGQGLFAPGQGIFPGYTSGVHGNMIISRGLANTAHAVPRLFNRREIVYIIPE